MLASKFCDFWFPRKRCADASDFICRDLLTISGTTKNYAERARFCRDCFGGTKAEDGVIIKGFVFEGSVIDNLMAIEM